jgi:hypothetical protein
MSSSKTPPQPQPQQLQQPPLNTFESIVHSVYCGLKAVFAFVGKLGVTSGGYVSSAFSPIISGVSSSLQNLDQIGKMKIGFIFVLILMIGAILSNYFTSGVFSKAGGIIMVIIFTCVVSIPIIYNIILRKQLGNDVPVESKVGNTSQIFIMALFVIALVVYTYVDPLAKLTDWVSGYSIFIVLAGFVCLFLLSYYKYLFHKYAGALLVFIAFIGLIYFWNPFEILTDHIDISSLAIISIGGAIIISMLIYQNNKLFATASDISSGAPMPAALSVEAVNTLNYFLGIVVVIMALYGLISIEQSYGTNTSVVERVLLIAIIFTTGTITYKFFNKSSFLDKYPIFRLIFNVLLYIPCIYVGKLEKIMKQIGMVKNFNNKTESTPSSTWILLASEFVLIGLYIAFPYIHKYFQRKVYIGNSSQGLLLINEAKDTRSENAVTSYRELNDSGDSKESLTSNYNYALSFWINIDAMPPSTGAQYNKYTSLFNYGEKPNIKYKASTNTFIVTTEMGIDNQQTKHIIDELKTDKGYDDEQIAQYFKEIGIELDEFDNRIVYKTQDFPMQRWNNVVINYSGGTLDIFFNGELVRSAIEIAPYIVNDSLVVGTTDGISGGICSLIYYKHTLTGLGIRKMYDSFKDKNPPTFIHDVEINIKQK